MICISLKISNGEHLSLCFLVICISSLEKIYSCSLQVFGLGHFVAVVFIGVLYMFWILIPYEKICTNIFSHLLGCLFTLLIVSFDAQDFPGGSDGKSVCLQCGRSGFDPWVGKIPLKKEEMATHSHTLAWKIPWTEKPGRLQSMGSQRVGYN